VTSLSANGTFHIAMKYSRGTNRRGTPKVRFDSEGILPHSHKMSCIPATKRFYVKMLWV